MSISSEFSLARSFALLAVLKRVEAFALRHVDDANFPDVVEPNWSTKQDLGEHDVSIEDSARLATDSEDEPRRNIIVVSILIDRFLRVNKKMSGVARACTLTFCNYIRSLSSLV
tara:strand:- start:605 stop:946 length:342 start_codon:yes stop_codon:yes gene_type:complete